MVLQHDTLCEARNEFEENLKLQSKLHQTYTPQALQDQLRIAAMQAEEESDSIAEDFLQSKRRQG